MTKQELTLNIINRALHTCTNHVLRLHMLTSLADRGCQPTKFSTINNRSFWLFTVAGQDFEYQDHDQQKWSVIPANSKYTEMKSQQPLELIN